MKSKQFVLGLLLTSAIVVLVKEPTRSEEILSLRVRVHKSIVSTDAKEDFTQQTGLITKRQTVELIRQIRQVSEIENPAKNNQLLLVQLPAQQTAPSQEIVQVRGGEGKPNL
ncbi:MAG: hypothetical protein V7K89_22630 [Nostoc sp.]|uniref:hypothetical protein n=1 Tax=Nostoc sp. TaxID=1180 RepID=UPI002FF5C4E4